jgi:hypothetical protein
MVSSVLLPGHSRLCRRQVTGRAARRTTRTLAALCQMMEEMLRRQAAYLPELR